MRQYCRLDYTSCYRKIVCKCSLVDDGDDGDDVLTVGMSNEYSVETENFRGDGLLTADGLLMDG